jgi:hypothetical protein
MEFLEIVRQWIDGQIAFYENRIAQQRARYQRENLRWTEEEARNSRNRIDELRTLRDHIGRAIMLRRRHGNDVLVLANIVWNEAADYGWNAKVAVAYAWLNRTGNVVREPVGSEISHFVPLLTRWNSLSEGEKLSFLRTFPDSVNAAQQRFAERLPVLDDPTNRATHWVSPIGLPAFSNQPNRYRRTVGRARDKAFPNWARATDDPEVARMQRRGSLAANFAEITADGVAREEFLFYTGVR